MTLSKLPYWTWSSISDEAADNWWTTLHQVQAHFEETGSLPVIRSKLGSWLDHEKGKKAGSRTAEQKAALKNLLALPNQTKRKRALTSDTELD